MTIVLAQEVQEALVVGRFHVEELEQHLVVAARVLQARVDKAAKETEVTEVAPPA